MTPRRKKSTLRKALELWEPPEGSGQHEVCVATSFTFDPVFFETECLGRFLQMDTHPAESEAVGYLVEREEKLAAAQVCAIVDRRHAREKESLRWDVLGVIVPQGIQHSKVSLLAWANCVRIIIGSGNLTEPGYRRNLEVFGSLETRREGGATERVVAAIRFLEDLVDLAVGSDGPDSPKGRTLRALGSVRRKVTKWPSSGHAAYPIPIFGKPGNPVVKQLFADWPARSPVRSISVLSPFFDVPGRDRTAVGALMDGMAQRGPRSIDFYVRAEPLPDDRTRVFAPLGMVQEAKERCNDKVAVYAVIPVQEGERRDLHAKMIQLENVEWSAAMIGSSNFTAAGLGASKSGGNVEANLFYAFRDGDSVHDRFYEIWPEAKSDEMDLADPGLLWDPDPEDAEVGGEAVPLPAAFHEVLFAPGPTDRLLISLRAPLPRDWSIRALDGRILLAKGQVPGQGEYKMAWPEREAPLVLEVTWQSGSGSHVANWPVNVANPAALAPPEELRSLSLEELLEILASTRSLPLAVASALRRRRRSPSKGPELDPLKRFDSQAALLRRTKRVGAALDRLKERLERPTLTREAFEWRLNGAVGPMRLADAFLSEAVLPGEARFYLAELALALGRVRPARPASGGLAAATIATLLDGAVRALTRMASGATAGPSARMLERYVEDAFAEAAQ